MKRIKINTRKQSVDGLRKALLQALEYSKGNIPKDTRVTIVKSSSK